MLYAARLLYLAWDKFLTGVPGKLPAIFNGMR